MSDNKEKETKNPFDYKNQGITNNIGNIWAVH